MIISATKKQPENPFRDLFQFDRSPRSVAIDAIIIVLMVWALPFVSDGVERVCRNAVVQETLSGLISVAPEPYRAALEVGRSRLPELLVGPLFVLLMVRRILGYAPGNFFGVLRVAVWGLALGVWPLARAAEHYVSALAGGGSPNSEVLMFVLETRLAFWLTGLAAAGLAILAQSWLSSSFASEIEQQLKVIKATNELDALNAELRRFLRLARWGTPLGSWVAVLKELWWAQDNLWPTAVIRHVEKAQELVDEAREERVKARQRGEPLKEFKRQSWDDNPRFNELIGLALVNADKFKGCWTRAIIIPYWFLTKPVAGIAILGCIWAGLKLLLILLSE